MATHSSVLDSEISWTEEPGGLQSMGSQKSQIGLRDQTATTNSCKHGFNKRCQAPLCEWAQWSKWAPLDVH